MSVTPVFFCLSNKNDDDRTLLYMQKYSLHPDKGTAKTCWSYRMIQQNNIFAHIILVLHIILKISFYLFNLFIFLGVANR